MKILHYLTILRPVNGMMAAGAVWLGAWISSARLNSLSVSVLAAVAFFSTGFGNAINDILDLKTDMISHPDRPLPSGSISVRAAVWYTVLLAGAALLLAFRVAPLYGFATLAPVCALTLYALFLKGTPLVGNLLVSLLVAYALLFGSLEAPDFNHLLLPALLAMFLNLSREIVKDIQDVAGDTAAGINTTAVLTPATLRILLFLISICYLSMVFLPFVFGHFGIPYLIVVVAGALPLHVMRLRFMLRKEWRENAPKISHLLKLEMLLGLAALAVDRLSDIITALQRTVSL